MSENVNCGKHELYVNVYLTQYLHILYTNIDRKLRNKLHGPMHYEIGVTRLFNGHELYSV